MAINVTNLGVSQYSATPQTVMTALGSDGHKYSVWWFLYPDAYNKQTNIFCLDHDNSGVCTTTVRGPYGRPFELMPHPDYYVYTGVYNGSNASSDLGKFNLSTGTYTFLHAGPSYSTGDGGPQYDGVGNGGMTWSDETNKRIFYYGSQRAGMWAYDPVTTIFRDYGILDDPGGSWVKRYGNSFQVSDGYAYCDIRDTSGNHYLVILDIDAGTTTTKWKSDPYPTAIDIYRGWPWIGDGLEIFVRRNELYWYNVDDLDTIIFEGATYIIDGNNQTYPSAGQRSISAWTGYYYDGSKAYPDGVGGKTIQCGWSNSSNYGGDPNKPVYQYVNQDLLDLDNYCIDGAGLDFNNDIITFPEAYGSAVKLDTSAGTFSSLGASIMSGYSVCRNDSNSRIYLGGYPNSVYEWNPAGSPVWQVGTNPVALSTIHVSSNGNKARYYYNCFVDSNGLVWYAVNMIRVAEESYLVWYDPSDDSSGDTWEVQLYSDSQPMYYSNMLNTAINLSKDRIVWSGVDKNYSYYALAVFNTSTKALVTYYQSLITGGNCGYVVSVEDGTAGTTNYFVGITEGANYKSYCVDISDGSLVWGPITNTGYTSSFLFANGPTYKGGYVWFYANSQLYKMNPANGDLTLAVDSAATPDSTHFFAFAVDEPAHHIWVGSTMYHWDTTLATNGKQVYRIDGLVSGYTRGSYVSLPADDADLTTPYTETDITNVATDDGVRVAQSVNIGNYVLHEFKNDAGSYNSVTLHWDGQTSVAPSDSVVKLQIYNRNTPGWEDVPGASNNTANANEDFALTGTVDITSGYKDDNNMISCRVWQQAV